ncbi:hypothetical protein DV451_002321 [Geotrichum candidum]|uniref:Threonine dehydratase n=1 Tax=Geotrichum candidum TaxID=1173061 RepID=A0A0J9XBE3_GEOCN|nr:hypothetical protein DV451_002321 [Geotrichum candidum]KAI9212019.1 hypothetical protein DS838_003082 [Geotrichum bryndzae]KAF5106009.1 hypothetical protein DV453_004294 [Geotrichum candidum]KAF5113176.1 hypothetical protein DV452_003764 [Geotrichum candidum]KAF5117334.1 hypothetical protein DV454_001152 [Geotrichum candidum]
MTVNSKPSISGLTENTTRSATPLQSKYSTIDPSFLLPDGTPDYLRLILTSRVYDVCKETPLTPAVNISQKLNSNILLKREDLQPVFSFKLRGAYNMISQLPKEDRWKGVIACSAGNHAQGVAYSAQHLNIPATIVMPVPTPSIKYQNVARLGSKVVLYGDDFDSAKAECSRLCKQHGLTNIPPFDDPYVIAGQGTIAKEILSQWNIHELKAIFVAIGGGGLIAGIGAYIKRIAPHIKVIGVETHDAHAMKDSLTAGNRLMLKEVGLFADGTAVKIVGEETFRVCKEVVDEIVLVSTDELCASIKDVFNDTRSIVEPSGALSLAGAKKYITAHPEVDHSESAYVCILSGANMNFDRLRFVSERSTLGEGSEGFFVLTIPEKVGSFEAVIDLLNPRAITEFSYRFQKDSEIANIYISFSLNDRVTEVPQIIESFAEQGCKCVDISDNEFAKTHARYLVGGKPSVENERLIRFEFPERPGALFNFLKGVQGKWMITLFHYRNHGSDIGKVLAGLQVPPAEEEEFQKFLHDLGYPHHDETDNEVYKIFLK